MTRSGKLLASGLVLLLGIVVVLFSVRNEVPPQGIGDHSDERGAVSDDLLCRGEEHISIEKGIAMQDFTVQLPETDDASMSNIADVCAADGGGLVVQYSSGIVVRQSINDLARPSEAWADIVKAYPSAGYRVDEVRGLRALVAPPGGELDLKGLAEWVEKDSSADVKFKIEGNGDLALADILAAAESLQPVSPS